MNEFLSQMTFLWATSFVAVLRQRQWRMTPQTTESIENTEKTNLFINVS